MTKQERALEELTAARLARGDVFEITVNGRKFKVGDRLTITGQRGVYEFRAARVNAEGVVQWLQVVGVEGTKNHSWRYFDPSKVKAKKRKVVQR